MPYILLKRDDIPAGLLQNLDLRPYTSSRVKSYQNPGQTGYRRLVVNEAASLTSGVVDETAAGLTAWMLSEVNDGTGAASAGTAVLASVVNGNSLTIGTTPPAGFTAAATQTSGNLDFLNSAAAGSDIAAATSLVTAINDDANWTAVGIARPVSADNAGGTSATVTITALADGTAGDYTLSENTGGTTIVVSGMTGGVDAGPLTGTQAATNAQDVLDLMAYGDVNTAAGDMDLAAINGALTTSSIESDQVAEILDLLAGRPFVLEQGAVVATTGVWAAGAGSFTDDPAGIRHIYETGALRLSFTVGRLSIMASDDFEYGGVAGAAVAVYNDDGSLFTA